MQCIYRVFQKISYLRCKYRSNYIVQKTTKQAVEQNHERFYKSSLQTPLEPHFRYSDPIVLRKQSLSWNSLCHIQIYIAVGAFQRILHSLVLLFSGIPEQIKHTFFLPRMSFNIFNVIKCLKRKKNRKILSCFYTRYVIILLSTYALDLVQMAPLLNSNWTVFAFALFRFCCVYEVIYYPSSWLF